MTIETMNLQVATAGEALIDLVAQPDGSFVPCLGGAVYNVTRALALQGVGTLYLNPLSGDRLGRQLAQALAQSGAQLACPQPVPEVTSLALVALDAVGHPDYTFYRQGVADRATTAQALDAACACAPGLQLVCTGALALSPQDADTYLPWLRQQRALGRTVVVDANMRPSVMPDLAAYRAHVRTVLQQAHIIKASDEDLAHLQLGAQGPLAQARALLQASTASCLVLTCGAEGAYLLTRHGLELHARATRPVTVVDTVGAGDCFLAGWVARWLALGLPCDWGQQAVDAAQARSLLDHAIASASINVQRQGCQPPTAAQVQAWLAVR
jgi:fructokinase